jgi:hypothetical protein
MAKAARTLPRNNDTRLIELGRKMAELRAKETAAIGDAIDRADGDPAHARVRAVWGAMSRTYGKMLAMTPTTLEGHRALARAILDRCSVVPKFETPEGDFERGAIALLVALTA